MFTPIYTFILIIFISKLNLLTSIPTDEDDPSFMEILIRNSKILLNDTLYDDTLAISDSCKQKLNNTYITGKNTYEAFFKTSEDSSKNKNDVGSYNDCVYDKTNVGENFTYFIISIKKDQVYNHTDSRYETGTYLFGICVITGCNESEYTEIFFNSNNKLENPFSITFKDEVNLYDVEENKKKQISWMVLVYLIPFYLFLIQLLFLIFPEIPGFLFKKCFKNSKSKHDLNDKDKLFLNGKDEYSKGSINGKVDDNMSEGHRNKNSSILSQNRVTKTSNKSRGKNSVGNINKNSLFKFKSSFDIVDNSEELFNKKPTSFNNESGLQYIKGIRGICMIYLIIGNFFIALFNSPTKIYEEKSFIKLHQRFAYSILFVGIRYAPRILFSCSGFSFIYKLLSYLGEKEEALINYTESSEIHTPVKFEVFFRFMMKQIHKYLLYIFVVILFRFSVYYVIFFTCEVGPLSIYYKLKELENVIWYKVLGYLLLYKPYQIGIESNCILDCFWMSLNEITFFIISTLIIFVFYKRKWRFDLFFLFLFILLMATKFGLFFIPSNVYYYPTVYYYHSMFGYFFKNPLYNYTYYILGIFFGLVNYSIQNNITKIKIAIEHNKNYLFSAISFIKIFIKRSKFFYVLCSIFGLTCIFVCCLSIELSLILIGTDDNLEPFFKNFYLNLWLLFDIELVVFLVNFVAFCLYLMGVNLFLNFLSHSIWISFSRSYFTYILINNPLIICFLYQSQSRIQLNLLNIFFFGFTFWLLNLLLCWISYISFELPWKRINKLIMEEKKEDDQLQNNENSN